MTRQNIFKIFNTNKVIANILLLNVTYFHSNNHNHTILGK